MHFQQEIKKQCDPCKGHRHPPQCKHPVPGKPCPRSHGSGGASRSHSGRRHWGGGCKSGLSWPLLPQTLISTTRHGGHYRRDVSRAGTAARGDKGPPGQPPDPAGIWAWRVATQPAPLGQRTWLCMEVPRANVPLPPPCSWPLAASSGLTVRLFPLS